FHIASFRQQRPQGVRRMSEVPVALNAKEVIGTAPNQQPGAHVGQRTFGERRLRLNGASHFDSRRKIAFDFADDARRVIVFARWTQAVQLAGNGNRQAASDGLEAAIATWIDWLSPGRDGL